MKNTFVIDENTFEFSITCQNARGATYITPLHLILDIFRNCHAIAVDDQLWKQYHKKAHALISGNYKLGKTIIKLIEKAVHNPRKGRFLFSVPNIRCASGIHRKDHYLVRLAVATKSILVTDDVPLKNSIDSSSMPVKYNFLVKLPSEAMSYALPNSEPCAP